MFANIQQAGGYSSGQVRARLADLRSQRVVALSIAGLTVMEIAAKLGVSRRTVYTDLRAQAEQLETIEGLLEDSPIDAGDLHLRLSEMFDADLADICLNPEEPIEDLRFKPIKEWPRVWRQGLAGKIKMIPVSQRSHDGEDKDGAGGWDYVGMRVEIDRADILKIIELAAKLKAVDAAVRVGNDSKEVAAEVMQAIDARIAEGRRRAAQRGLVAQAVIDVEPEA